MTSTSGGVRRAIAGALIVIVVLGAAIVGVQRLVQRRDQVRYVTRPATFADISATVTEVGTVNPVDEVQVGSQVSGTIVSINVDYNSKVKKGEVLATLDQAPFHAAAEQASANLAAAQATAAATDNGVAQAQAAVQSATGNLQQAQANLRSVQANAAKAQAQLALAELTVKRDESLLQQGFIPQSQLDIDRTTAQSTAEEYRAAQAAIAAAQAQIDAAAAQLRSAQAQVRTAQAQTAAAQHQVAAAAAQLQQAQYNLSRTVITSPIDGIVLARNISVGQTVAASFQTPTLFTLATNLTNMQVDTSVNEADVASVRTGETAHISVTAYPNVTFSGTVQQVRVNPTIVQNVVTYDAVVIVHDASGRLKPGMTAQVTIGVSTRRHVLAVPLAALLYRPLASQSAPRGAPGGVPFGAFGTVAVPTVPPAVPVAGALGSQATVWVLRDGRPVPVPVVIGLSDSKNVEVTSGNLKERDPVIIAQVRGPAKLGPGISLAGGGTSGLGGRK